ncbi:IclR family transcriptional regulator C-terminal domain-containing protein [Streptomyces sp. NPDC005799]|uniref:IclR family transcriptional regulator domain-containing protein n=1 Tax=Streptomyces sp. NPDC005799 TaxID=3154678 RepID=UPI003408A090
MPANPEPDAVASSAVPAEAVTPLIRGVAVLHRLTEAGGTLSLSALERATGLARSTVDRVTATLARMGYVRLDGRDVFLTPRLMELGNAYLAALRLPALLDARADALADELDESVSLAVADRDGIRFIHQATRRRAMSLSFRIGDLLPAERTAPGPLFATEWTEPDWQAWRKRRTADPQDRSFPAVPPRETTDGEAELDREAEPPAQPAEAVRAVRGSGEPDPHSAPDFERRVTAAAEDGWALDDQLIEPGLVAVSVPVRDPRTGRIVCAASVVSHTSRHTAADLRDTLLPRLRTAVRAMEDDLRAAPPRKGEASPSGLATWTGASKQELGREFVESLARGLTVLTAFGEGRSALTLTEVAQATGLARATARRALITYEHLGLVRATDRFFELTPRVLGLGFPPLSRTTLPEIAGPRMAELAARVHESTSLSVLSGPDIQYTARVATRRVMSVNLAIGTRLPAYATSMGRVLLADLPEPDRTLGALRPLTSHTITDPAALAAILDAVRAAGYALVDEELEEGLRSIAVPVRDRTGRAVAALNVAMHAARHSVEECVRDILPELRRTATLVEADLHVAGRFTRIPVS